MERVVSIISKQFPCREAFIRKLYHFYGTDDPFPPALHVYGQNATGKLSIITSVLRELSKTNDQFRYTVINTLGCHTNRLFFETIAMALHGYELSPDNNYTYHQKLEYMKDFLADLRQLDSTGTYVIAIRNAERLDGMGNNLLPMLLQLPEATGLNISVMLISSQTLATALPAPIAIYVPNYTRDDAQIILKRDFEEVKSDLIRGLGKAIALDSADDTEQKLTRAIMLSEEFYENYVHLFIGTFWKVCRDVKELRLVAKQCFNPYVAPILEGKMGEDDSVQLWRNVADVLKTAIGTLYMRLDTTNHTEDSSRPARNLELPYYAKYLLIAAYLASHNATKEDKRLFMKQHDKKRKRMQTINARAVVTERMSTQLGPKTFNVDRLLAIFYAILDEKVGLTCNMLVQISTLVHLKFLVYASAETGLLDGSTRLQCTVGMDFILQIGRMVNFNVRSYLCDFL